MEKVPEKQSLSQLSLTAPFTQGSLFVSSAYINHRLPLRRRLSRVPLARPYGGAVSDS